MFFLRTKTVRYDFFCDNVFIAHHVDVSDTIGHQKSSHRDFPESVFPRSSSGFRTDFGFVAPVTAPAGNNYDSLLLGRM